MSAVVTAAIRSLSFLGAFAASMLAATPSSAADDEELQKKLANPIADLVSVPVQLTTTGDTGPLRRPQHTLNLQPVYPMGLGSGVLIHRLIVPLLSNPADAPGQDRQNGLGDITYEAFYSAAPDAATIWAVGPIVQMRTATDDRLGSGKWAAGPAVVFLRQPGQWSYGALVTQLWSFAGDDNRRSVNRMQLQPILSYRLNARHTVGYLGTITADWEESRSSQRWTVPLGLSWSALVKRGSGAPVNYVVGAGYNVVHPDNAGTWFLRLQMTFIFPK